MIRLRRSIETALRHPLLGPLLLLFLALVLAFVVLHAVERDVEGLLVGCAILAAVVLPLVAVHRRISPVRRDLSVPARRAKSPSAWLLRAPPTGALALPLRL